MFSASTLNLHFTVQINAWDFMIEVHVVCVRVCVRMRVHVHAYFCVH
jgi:hypothetical protein